MQAQASMSGSNDSGKDRIVDVIWTPMVNVLIVQCHLCLNTTEVRADRAKATCRCGHWFDVHRLKAYQ